MISVRKVKAISVRKMKVKTIPARKVNVKIFYASKVKPICARKVKLGTNANHGVSNNSSSSTCG